MKYLKITLQVLLFSGDIKEKKKKKALKKKKKKKNSGEKKHTLKMTSQLVIFRAFLFIFFSSPDPRSEKKIPVNQLIKNLALSH